MRVFLRLSSFLLFMCICTFAIAQNRQVSGSVTDKADGSAMPGVGVSYTYNGTKGGDATDDSGNFSLSVPQGVTTLKFTSVGYGSQEVAIPASGRWRRPWRCARSRPPGAAMRRADPRHLDGTPGPGAHARTDPARP